MSHTSLFSGQSTSSRHLTSSSPLPDCVKTLQSISHQVSGMKQSPLAIETLAAMAKLSSTSNAASKVGFKNEALNRYFGSTSDPSNHRLIGNSGVCGTSHQSLAIEGIAAFEQLWKSQDASQDGNLGGDKGEKAEVGEEEGVADGKKEEDQDGSS